MKSLVIGTQNDAKANQIAQALVFIKIKLFKLNEFNIDISVKEDGKTTQENARKKSLTYAKKLQCPVLSIDNGLYFDDTNFPKKLQPGLNVRRIGNANVRASDDEMIKYYSNIVRKYGKNGVLRGYWEYATCIATPAGKYFETCFSSYRLFTFKTSSKIVPGYPLESIQIDPNSKKYISEMTQDEQGNFWLETIGNELSAFVKKTLKNL